MNSQHSQSDIKKRVEKSISKILNVFYGAGSDSNAIPIIGKINNIKAKINTANKALEKILYSHEFLGDLKYYLGNLYLYQPKDRENDFFVLHHKLEDNEKELIVMLPWPKELEKERNNLEKKYLSKGTTYRCVPRILKLLQGEGSNIIISEKEIKQQHLYITPREIVFLHNIYKTESKENVQVLEREEEILNKDDDIHTIYSELIKYWESLTGNEKNGKKVDFQINDEFKKQILEVARLKCDFEFSDETKIPYSLLIMPIHSLMVNMDAQEENKGERIVFFSAEFKKRLTIDEINEFRKVIAVIVSQSLMDIYQIQHQQREKAVMIQQGSRAAMTAIMSRNLSHNIGSHILSYWINTELKEAIDKEDFTSEVVTSSKGLFQYIQQRMDFLAEVSTSEPSSEMSLDFETDIMSTLVGKRDKKSGQFSGYNFPPFLKYIACSEKINIKPEAFNLQMDTHCRRISVPGGNVGAHAIYSILENFIRNSAKHYKQDGKNVAGKIKLQIKNIDEERIATFNNKYSKNGIFIKEGKTENYLVADKELIKELELNNNALRSLFQLENKLNEQITNKDFSIKIELRRPEQPSWASKYIEFRIWDMRESSCSDNICQSLNNFLKDYHESFVKKEDGSLEPNAWGIKEMLICANFLRKKSTNQLFKQDDKDDPLIMEILCGDNPTSDNPFACTKNEKSCNHTLEEHKGRLGYRFYLLRPLHLAILADADKATVKQQDDHVFEIKNIKKLGQGSEYINDDGKIMREIPYQMLLTSNPEKYSTDPMAPFRICGLNSTGNGSEEIDDTSYLKQYEMLIKSMMAGNSRQLPKLLFTGGGSYLFYTHLFDKFKQLGHSQSEDKLSDNDYQDKIVCYNHLRDEDEKGFEWIIGNKPAALMPLAGHWSLSSRCKQNIENSKLKKHFLLELIESALAKVIIVDERICNFAGNDFNSQALNREVFKWMNVLVPDIMQDSINQENLVKQLKEIDTMNGSINIIDEDKNQPLPYVFVIHQGVLDKLEKAKEKSSIEFMKSIKCRWKVISSGRGIPNTLKEYEDARFIVFSNLSVIMTNYDKHSLVQALFASRRPHLNEK